MNDSTNTPQPKKSFWAKLFGSKDTVAQQTPSSPIPVPPVNQSAAQPGGGLSGVTPPSSELNTPPVPFGSVENTPTAADTTQAQTLSPIEETTAIPSVSPASSEGTISYGTDQVAQSETQPFSSDQITAVGDTSTPSEVDAGLVPDTQTFATNEPSIPVSSIDGVSNSLSQQQADLAAPIAEVAQSGLEGQPAYPAADQPVVEPPVSPVTAPLETTGPAIEDPSQNSFQQPPQQ